MTELNTLYLNGQSGTCYNWRNNAPTTCDFSSIGLNHGGSDLIDDAVWNTGTIDGATVTLLNATARDFYLAERSENTGKKCSSGTYCNDTVTRTTTWTGKVGLMYPSDYGYATGGGSTYNRSNCLTKELFEWSSDDYQTDCAKTSWLLATSDQLTMTALPDSDIASGVAYVYPAGSVLLYDAGNNYITRPVVYLKHKAIITGGDGTQGNPYEFVIENDK